MYGLVKNMSQTMRKEVSIAQAMILMRLRPIAISQAIVHGKVPIEKLKHTTLRKVEQGDVFKYPYSRTQFFFPSSSSGHQAKLLLLEPEPQGKMVGLR